MNSIASIVATFLSISGIAAGISGDPVSASMPGNLQSIVHPDDSADELEQLKTRLLHAGENLSATTHTNGPGWEMYATLLHEDFTRWSAGQEVYDRRQSIELIKDWWEAGNSVDESTVEIISCHIAGSTAVVRKKMFERFVDGEGNETGSFTGFVTQTWVIVDEKWKLPAATIQVDQ